MGALYCFLLFYPRSNTARLVAKPVSIGFTKQKNSVYLIKRFYKLQPTLYHKPFFSIMSEEIISRLGDDVASELTLENFMKCGQLPFEENLYAKKTTHGAKAFMVKELKALKMK